MKRRRRGVASARAKASASAGRNGRRGIRCRHLDEEAFAVPRIGSRVIYQHPLAYLLGLEGIALLRAFAGEYDTAFVQARLAEVRRLLDTDALTSHAGVTVDRRDAVTG